MTATPLSFKESAELLDRYHIQSAGKEVYSISDALDAAQSLGYTAVVKPVSKKILQKSDKGAVFLNLEGPEALTSACQELETLMGGFSQKAGEGILIQKMADNGFELLVGAKQDPGFGPITMVGMDAIFNAKSVAIIGASRPGTQGGVILS